MGQTPADGTSVEERDPQQPYAVGQAFVEDDPSSADAASPVSEQPAPGQPAPEHAPVQPVPEPAPEQPDDAPQGAGQREHTAAAHPSPAQPASDEIATLPPTDELVAPGLPISSSTGQPRRAKWMVAANVLLYAASVVSAVALARSWWLAMHMPSFMNSSTLVQLWQPRPGGWRSVVAVTLVAAIGAILVAAPAIAALNAWNGHRWSRIAALVATALGGLAYLVGPWAWPAPVLSLLGALLLFLPAVTRYFGHWEQFRAGTPVPVREQREVVYGPLPRYL